MNEGKPILEEEKTIAEETVRLVETKQARGKRPRRKKKAAVQVAKNPAELIEEFFKKTPAPIVPIIEEKPEEMLQEEPIVISSPVSPNLIKPILPLVSSNRGESFNKLYKDTDLSEQEEQIMNKEKIVDQTRANVFAEEGRQDGKKKWLKIFLIVFATLLILGLIGASGYFYYKYKIASQTNPAEAEKEVQTYATKIGKFILLPEEVPTLATVADVEKLKEQPFFSNAQNGDKVLFYNKAQKAILYRPSENKIIEVMNTSSAKAFQENVNNASEINTTTAVSQEAAPADSSGQGSVQIPTEETPANPSEQVPAPVEIIETTIAIYNGTNTKGLAKTIGEKVALITGVTISEKTNAVGSYKKSLVIDLSGNRGKLAQQIAEVLGGEIGTLPEGETKPVADILIIGGSDFQEQSL